MESNNVGSFDDYLKANKRALFLARWEALAAQPSGERRIRNRPRDPEKQQLLMELDQKRWERWQAEGKLVQRGPRHWEWR